MFYVSLLPVSLMYFCELSFQDDVAVLYCVGPGPAEQAGVDTGQGGDY